MGSPTILVAGAILGVGGRRAAAGLAANDNRRAPTARGLVIRLFPRPDADSVGSYRGVECAAVGEGFVVIETFWPGPP